MCTHRYTHIQAHVHICRYVCTHTHSWTQLLDFSFTDEGDIPFPFRIHTRATQSSRPCSNQFLLIFLSVDVFQGWWPFLFLIFQHLHSWAVIKPLPSFWSRCFQTSCNNSCFTRATETPVCLLGCLQSELLSSHAHDHRTRDSEDDLLGGRGGPDADGRCFDHLHLQDRNLLGKEGMLKRDESTVEIPSSLVGT